MLGKAGDAVVRGKDRSQLVASAEEVGQFGDIIVAQVQVHQVSWTGRDDELQELIVAGDQRSD